MALLITSCSEKDAAPIAAQGQLVAGVTAAAMADEDYPIARLLNNSGMSGTAGRTHSHSSNGKAMWRWTATDSAQAELQIDYDLGEVVPLGEMWIWNYNEVGKDRSSYTQYGLKDIRIEYSTNGEDWQEWKGPGHPYRLAQASGDSFIPATNLDDGHQTPIQFQGTPIRYLRMTVDTMPGQGNWAEADSDEHIFGLSEVRFYRYAQHVDAGRIIVPVSARISGEFPESTAPEHAINLTGMSGYGGKQPTHGNDPESMWLFTPSAALASGLPALTVDLGGTYPIQELHIWNYNAQGAESKGLKQVRIFYSIDQIHWDELQGAGYPYELAKASGSAKQKATNLNDGKHSPIRFDNRQARYIKLVPSKEEAFRNWGSADGAIGLSELRVVAGRGMAIEPALDWESLFSQYNGWSGADGIFSIPMNGNDASGQAEPPDTLFLFSDTFAGTVDPVSLQRYQTSMLHNSVGWLEGGMPDASLIEYTYLPNGADVHLFTPKTPSAPSGSWYWLQDGTVIGDHLYLFPLVMVPSAGTPGFNFAIHGVTMIKLPIVDGKPEIHEQEQLDTPLHAELPDGSGAILFGAGIMDHTEQAGAPDPDGYIYIYGYKDIVSGNKQLVAARVQPEQLEDFAQWRFWDGEAWSEHILDSAALAQGVSPELSVTPISSGSLAGKYLLISEKDTLSGYVAMSVGESPVGPFTKFQNVYYTPELNKEKQIFTYNAKAHPHLSQLGELLLSYNVNTTDPSGNELDADVYRPRWVKLRELGVKFK